MKPPRNYMQSEDSLADALEDALATYRGEGSEEDVLDAALDASMDAEGAKRIAHATGRAPPNRSPVPEANPEGALPPECASGECEHPEHWQDMDDMPMEH